MSARVQNSRSNKQDIWCKYMMLRSQSRSSHVWFSLTSPMIKVIDIDCGPTEEGWAEGSNRMEPCNGDRTDYMLLHAAMNLIFCLFLPLIHISPWSENGNTSPNTHALTHTNGGNGKVTVTIDTPSARPGSASVLQTNQPAAWIGGGRSRKKEEGSEHDLRCAFSITEWRGRLSLCDCVTCL